MLKDFSVCFSRVSSFAIKSGFLLSVLYVQLLRHRTAYLTHYSIILKECRG